MSETSGVDESGFGAGGESSIDADVEASGSGVEDRVPEGSLDDDESGNADGEETDSYEADVEAGYDDPSKAPVATGADDGS